MVPYSPGKPISEAQRELGLDRIYKLASNENPLGPSPKAVEAVRRAAETMHIYPDGSAYELKSALAQKFGVARESLAIGNGSDELIHLVGTVLLGEDGDEVVVGDPSFSRYNAAAEIAPCKLVRVPLDADFAHDLPAMAKAVTAKTRLVFVANPNNPTGTIVRKPEMDAFVRDLPDDVALVLDEAYYDFAADEPDFPQSIDYIREGRVNVIGLRTFSKSYGLAGIRIGYGFMDPAMADAIDRAREPFNANSLALAAAVAALDDDEHVRRTVENNRRVLADLDATMRRHGFKPCKSYGNFCYVELGMPARPVFEALLRLGVIVRCGDVFGQPTCLRITVGTAQEMKAFVEAFDRVMATMPTDSGVKR